MGRFSDYFRGRGEENTGDGYEYYEDTHGLGGSYTERLRSFQRDASRDFTSEQRGLSSEQRSFSTPQRELETSSSRDFSVPERRREEPFVSKKSFSSFMVYEPRTADDVQTLIDFLKTKESAIINLNNVEEDISQRVLDFVSGAIYALNGSVHRIEGNIFLLSPEGVGITDNSYESGVNEK